MTERELFDGLLLGWFVLAAVVFVVLFFISAPYGRQARGGWGPMIPARLAWVVMETPPVAIFLAAFALGDRRDNLVAMVFLAMWLTHYVHRAYVYPFRMRARGKQMPLFIATLAFVTNCGIDYLNARWLFALGPTLDASWLLDPRFVIGAALFATGMAINLHSDTVLLGLGRGPDGGYQIPRGGAYRWLSCPNYAGEILEWSGWALATWSLPGLAFAVWTAANLAPRARTHHAWYRQRFPDYPRGRRALLPGLW